MNILLVNLGRHVSLYQQVVNSDIAIDNIYIAENDIEAPSCVLNNKGKNIKISKAKDNNFITNLLTICKQKKIDYLFPFIDYGLLELAKNKCLFEKLGTKIVVSDCEAVKICEDKYVFSQYLKENGLECVPTFLNSSIVNFYSFPYFAKPRYESASLGIAIINNTEDLNHYLNKENYIIQPYIKDREFGIDLLVKNGQIYDIFIKEKLKLRAGTTDKAISAWEDNIFGLIKILVGVFNFDGAIDIDVFKYGKNYFINEINPRFGGGYASAIICGKNFFKRYLNDSKNTNVRDYELKVKTVRYETTIVSNRFERVAI